MKTTVTILGRKISVFVLLGICAITIFITLQSASGSIKCSKELSDGDNHGHRHGHNHGHRHRHGHRHGPGGCCKTKCNGTCKKCTKNVHFAPNVKGYDGPNYTPLGGF